MFERFTAEARTVVIQAQDHARRLGHSYIGCQHLLLAAAAISEPASAVLREHGVTPQAVETEIVRLLGPGQAASLLGSLDREALAAIGIDLDVVRARIEAAFRAGGPHTGPIRPSAPTWGAGGTRSPGCCATGGAAPGKSPPRPQILLRLGTSPSPLAPKRAWNTPSARPRCGTTTTSASSTSRLPLSA